MMLTFKQRQLLAYTQNHVGPVSSVTAWESNAGSIKVPIGCVQNSPDRNLQSYATLGLSDYPIGLRNKDGLEIRVELLGTARAYTESFLPGFGDSALQVADSSYQPFPGRVFPNMFSNQLPPLPNTLHALLWYPFAWETDFENLTVEGVEINWLTVLPITDEEFAFVQRNGAGFRGEGTELLIDLFEVQHTDVWDLNRKSVV